MNFQQKLDVIVKKNDSLLCVGLDSDVDKISNNIKNDPNPQFIFNRAVIDATHDLVCAYKPNSAFYEARGNQGIAELKLTCDYIHEIYPEIVIILDTKRGDIGSSNKGYIRYAFDWLRVDAMTLNPYVGREAMQPYLDRKEKGCIVLCRTSNPGAGEFQDLIVDGKPLYQIIAKKVVDEWNENGNCALVVGATYPHEIAMVRQIVGNKMILLIPGIGSQGGNLQEVLMNGLNSQKNGLIINSSRSIIYSSQIRIGALKLRDHINRYRTLP